MSDRCNRLEEEVEQYITAQEAYEQQLSSMAKSLSNMEEQLRQANQEKVFIYRCVRLLRLICCLEVRLCKLPICLEYTVPLT